MPLRVDAATGATTLYEEDLRLPGPLPLVLARAYRSDRVHDGPLGPGWHFSLDVTLAVERERMVFRGATGREIVFAPVRVGVQARHHETGLVVQHHPHAFVVFFSPLMQQVFPKQGASGNVLRLGRVEDLSGNVVQLGYQGARLTRLADAAGRQIGLTYGGDRITAVHVAGPEGTVAVRAFRYDGAGDLVAARDAAGREWRYAYQNHLMVACTNRLGGTCYAQYDEARRCTAVWYGDNSTVRRLAYDPPRQTTLVQATDGLQTVYQHEGPRVVARIGPSGEVQGFLYDEQRRLLGFTDDAGELAVAQRLDPDEQTFTLLAGPSSMMTGPVDERGLARQVSVGGFGPFELDYDDRARLAGCSAPSGARWRFERNARGQVTRTTTPEGRQVLVAHSPDGRELRVSDELGIRFTGRFDLLGRLVECADGLGRRQRRQVDPEGRLLHVALQSGYQIRFGYDPEGRLAGISDNEGYQAALQHDAFGRLRALRSSDANAEYRYDREGRLVEATGDAGAVRLEYDAGRLAAVVTPDGRRRSISTNGEAAAPAPVYGLAGELLGVGVDDEATTFGYDEDGRLTTVEVQGQTLALGHDGDGLPTSLLWEDRPPVFLRRDRRGRLVEAAGDGEAVHRFEYDAADRLVGLHTPSGSALALRYDALDRLVEMQDEHGTRRVGPKDVTTRSLHDTDEGPPWAVLAAGRHGVALVAPLGDRQVLLWIQDDLLHRNASTRHDRFARIALHGVEALLRRRVARDPLGVLRAWGGDPTFHPLSVEVPGGTGPAGIPLPLGGFFLRRAYHDYFYPGWAPFSLPHHDAAWGGAEEPLVSGTHRSGPLKPPPPTVPPGARPPEHPGPHDLALLLDSLT